MQTITVEKNDLLHTLRENRKRHKAQYEQARDGYRQKVGDELAKRLEQVRAGKPIDLAFRLPEPRDHTADYDRAILMLEWDTDTEVSLDHQEFQTYVQDDWTWKRDFAATNSTYGV